MSRAGATARVWYNRLDPGVPGVLWPLEVHRLAVDEQLAGVGHERAAEALDERRLAGALSPMMARTSPG
jgi:hypothetical protein